MALLLLWQVRRTGLKREGVAVPLHVACAGRGIERVVDRPEDELLHGWPREVEHALPSPEDRLAMLLSERPLWMVFEELAARADHLRFQPDAKADAPLLRLLNEVRQPIWQLAAI